MTTTEQALRARIRQLRAELLACEDALSALPCDPEPETALTQPEVDALFLALMNDGAGI